MRPITIAILAATLAAVPSARAEDAKPEVTLTLDEAVKRALERAPTLDALRATTEASRAGLNMAQAERYPHLDLLAGYTRYSHVSQFTVPLGGTPTVLYPDIPDIYGTRAEVNSALYTFGRIGAAVSAAHEEVKAASEDEKAGLADIVLTTRIAFWDLLVAHERERVLDESIGAYEAHQKDAENREKVGLAARNDVLAIEVERRRAELARIEATHSADVAETVLRTWLEYPPGTIIDAVPPAEAQPAGPPLDLGEAVSAAITQRPERVALDARREALEDRSRAASRSRLPQLSFAAGYDYARPNHRITPPEDEWHDSWDVSVNLAWSLFDGGRARAESRRAREEAASLGGSIRELERRIEIELTSAHLEVEAAERALEVSDQALVSGRENLRVAGDRYREGLIPSSERLDAETALLRANLDRTQALARRELAAARLERAMAGTR